MDNRSVDNPDPPARGSRMAVNSKSPGRELLPSMVKEENDSFPCPYHRGSYTKNYVRKCELFRSAADSFPGSIENEIGPYAFDGRTGMVCLYVL